MKGQVIGYLTGSCGHKLKSLISSEHVVFSLCIITHKEKIEVWEAEAHKDMLSNSFSLALALVRKDTG